MKQAQRLYLHSRGKQKEDKIKNKTHNGLGKWLILGTTEDYIPSNTRDKDE